MIHRFLQQVTVSLAAQVSRFEREPRVVFRRVYSLTGIAATLQVPREPVEQPAELALVVERSDHLVATFVTLRIVRIPAHDVALNSVIVRVYGRHPTIVRPVTTLPTDARSGRPGFTVVAMPER